MPSFDAVSEVDTHELSNALDQANRELKTRYDFRNIEASFKQEKQFNIILIAEAKFQLQQMLEILKSKLIARNIDTSCLEIEDAFASGKLVKQNITIRQGIDQNTSRSILKIIKESKIKVQASIQGEQIRVTGKKRDDLQAVMKLLKETDLAIPVQYQNFRD
jgi:uncharacterized protein YajQ (UPF0234 family)